MNSPRRFLLVLIFLLLAAPTLAARAQTPTAMLKPGDGGPAVEDLQRRLNVKLEPSPNLGVDGDYGEATRAAVSRFQREKGLPPTGVADPATREALGFETLSEPIIPEPEVVNARVHDKEPADSIDDPPHVSARAWAIADGRTGEVLWGHRRDEPLPMASTTKMMTALIVGRIVKDDPKALQEIVTFSDRADQTPGSTAGIRAGESLPVSELLYGMMLPSGNDATVAFAEHFGGRLSGEGDPLDRFVAAMNRTAEELGLSHTRFANPHGLGADGHHAGAGDLARLASVLMRDPLLARVVATPERGCVLVAANGNKRNIVWTNTNRLLKIDGYDGVKTGTTTAAGNCLVASGRRGDDRLIVVVLGSATTDARYLDARNLFQWGWTRRADR